MEIRGGADLQNSSSLEIDACDKARIRALPPTAWPDCDVQQGTSIARITAFSYRVIQGMESFTSAVGALKKLALLEPDLILPSLMERVVPSLQGLEEVSRRILYATSSIDSRQDAKNSCCHIRNRNHGSASRCASNLA